MVERQLGSRRLLLLFLAATVIPAVLLLWLGWRLVAQDRVLEVQQAVDRRDQAANIAASALQRILAEAEERLTAYDADPKVIPSMPGGAALLVLSPDVLLHRTGAQLPYYPAVSSVDTMPSGRFAEADQLEFQKQDVTRALAVLFELARSADNTVRGEALLRIARLERKRGNPQQMLAALQELSKLDQSRISGSPAGLVAHQARSLLFQSTGRAAELRQEAAVLLRELAEGRWMLTRGEFAFSYEQAQRWNPNAGHRVSPSRIALADGAAAVWQEWRSRSPVDTAGRERRMIRVSDTSILALTRSSADRLTLLLISPEFLEAMWLRPLHTQRFPLEYALSDAEGLPVMGQPNSQLSRQSVRPASATRLPWTVHAITPDAALVPGLSARARIMLAGIGLMVLLVVSVAYFMNRTLTRELEVARLQSDFVAAVSHEFRTPLSTLRQLSEMLVHGRVSSDQRRQQFYETLLRESERLHRLVDGLLSFGRLEAGQIQYRFEAVDAKEFVGEVISEFQREGNASGYEIQIESSTRITPILADRQTLARVFWNLLDNAVKYSPDEHTIRVELSNAGPQVRIRVCDRGVGIPVAEQEEVFRKFVRGTAAKTASIRGTGVGLAIARQIVTAHGGGISVESEPGRGSVFTVLLPATRS